MAKKTNETAIKGRQTKLEKKSHNELVQIVLKKDKVERNLNNQIVNLKSEVNSLTSCINKLKKDCDDSDKTIKSLSLDVKRLYESNHVKNEQINSAKLEVNEIYNKYTTSCKTNVALNAKCKSYKQLTWTFGVCVVLLLLCIFL